MARVHHSKKQMIITWSIASVIALAMSLSIFFTRAHYNLAALIDASFIPGAFLLGVALLVLIARTGTYDLAAYSFIALGQRFRPRELRQYSDAYDYKVKADERRSKQGVYVLPFFIWSGALLLTALIANIIFMTSI